MRAFLQRILVASQWGASLVLVAGCSSNVNGGNGGAGGSGTPLDGGTPVGNVDPLPTPECSGPIYDGSMGGYDGQCCEKTLCTAPTDGYCPAAEVAKPTLDGLPPGSGTCECSPIRGPYAGTSDAGDAICCYLIGSIGCEGRPLVVHGEARLADVIAAPSAWSSAPPDRDAARRDFPAALAALDVASLPAAVRDHLARRWADRARNEHASVASFGRFAIALMALGAPPALVEAAHRAAIDEVDHARLCLALTSAYAGEARGFGALRVDGAFGEIDSLEAAAVDTVIEGCVGETLAALEAAATAAQAGPEAVRLALQAIAEDEARHAELGWAFVRWALGMGDARLTLRVMAAFEAAMQKAMAGVETHEEEPPVAHGFLPAAEIGALRRQAVAEVIRPAAAALVRGRRETSITTAPAVV
ncbi:MAG: hypothetical protein QM820_25935 [Minicystis sp.]